jgi:hypothetical protein
VSPVSLGTCEDCADGRGVSETAEPVWDDVVAMELIKRVSIEESEWEERW